MKVFKMHHLLTTHRVGSYQQAALNLIESERYFVAYAVIRSLTVQIPPMRVVTQEREESLFVNFTTQKQQLSTDCECGMWIAAECATKVSKSRNPVAALVTDLFLLISH